MPQDQALNQKPNSKRKKKFIIVVIIAILIVLTGSIFWVIWGKKPSFTGDNVSLMILSDTKEIASGNDVEFTISYANDEKVALKDIEINLLYPDGFVFEKASLAPEKDSKNRWVKSKIAPGEADKIVISGRLLGNPNETKNFTAELSYKPANFNSRFSREATHQISITKSELQIETDMPKIIQEGESLKYSIKIKNTGHNEIKNLQVRGDFPSSFEMKENAPKEVKDNVWEFSNFKADQEEEIKINGKLYGDAGETKTFKIQAGQVDEKGEFYLQNEKEVKIKIIKLDLSLQAQINKESSIVANLGDEVELKINYKNKSSENLPNIVVEAIIDESLFDKNGIQVSGGKYEKGKIIWDKSTKPELSQLNKDASGELSARLKILQDITMSSVSDKNFSAKFKVKLRSNLRDLGGSEFTKESNEVEVKVNTKVGYNIEIRYYDQNGKKAVGSGPIPPRVGQETTYRVYLNLTNTTNDADNAKVEVYLPSGVSFAGGKTAQSGILDYFDGKIIWNLDKLQAGVGKIKPQLQANFDISITPEKSIIGRAPKLIEKSSFSGRDAFTNNKINIDRGILTTELERDLKAKELGGKVVE